MRTKVNNIIIFISGLFCFLIIIVNSALAAPNLKNAFGEPLTTTATKSGYQTDVMLTTLAGQIITVVLSILGVVFVIFCVYGGYLYMTAAGNEEKTKKGINIITQSLIGLVIIISAYAISYFIVKLVI